MIEYIVSYIDKEGDFQDIEVASTDVRTAMNNTFELCPDCKRILRCIKKSIPTN